MDLSDKEIAGLSARLDQSIATVDDMILHEVAGRKRLMRIALDLLRYEEDAQAVVVGLIVMQRIASVLHQDITEVSGTDAERTN